jgi:twinkle protein
MTSARLDFSAIARAAAGRAEDICRRLLPRGRRQGRDWVCGSVAGEPGGSLRICITGDRAGRWIDHATGERGGDLIALAAAVARIPQIEAARRLAGMLGKEPR